eukprot:CAMPEP_0204501408 /NCGR_PEP_ID=MMETSP0471-20130131/99177_1 /ASSEMBLY_ACC=CAM_ASM_000602 /TAXON_ID=2969 /ORGANISM="Oxyrrhis marina" /LENGTH=122 /DNA_ID=CAMNT_0051506083 /DNA_START=207 /DNA_END=573 /DNA_ORIENTATION=-
MHRTASETVRLGAAGHVGAPPVFPPPPLYSGKWACCGASPDSARRRDTLYDAPEEDPSPGFWDGLEQDRSSIYRPLKGGDPHRLRDGVAPFADQPSEILVKVGDLGAACLTEAGVYCRSIEK